MAGYSSTPLAKKLGIKPGIHMALLHAPEYYFDLFADFPEDVIINKKKNYNELIHFFTKSAKELHQQLPILKNRITQIGCIWVSWPKKSAGVPTDVTEDVIRTLATQNGLVDVKVCAVDNTWSALKLVIPLKDRIS